MKKTKTKTMKAAAMNHKIHNFKDSLEYSHKFVNAWWWEFVYRNAFAEFVGMYSVREDGWAQRGGIDRIIILKGGKTLSVDEKVRELDYPDILLEYYSDRDKKIPGWIRKDSACDYIAYAFVPSQKCFLFPFQQLRKAYRDNLKIWWQIYTKIPAHNKYNGREWTTMSLAVPIDILLESIKESMFIKWDNNIHLIEKNKEDDLYNEYGNRQMHL